MTGSPNRSLSVKSYVVLTFFAALLLIGPAADQAQAGPSYLPGWYHLMASPAIVEGQTYNVTFGGPDGSSATVAVKANTNGLISVPVPPYIGAGGDFVMGAALTVTLEGITSGEITINELPVLPDGDYAGFLISAWNNNVSLLSQSLAYLNGLGSSANLDAAKAAMNSEAARLTALSAALQTQGSITMGSGEYQGTYTADDLKDGIRLLYSQWQGVSQAALSNYSAEGPSPMAQDWPGWWFQINDRVEAWENKTEGILKQADMAVTALGWFDGKLAGGVQEVLTKVGPFIQWFNTQFQTCLNITLLDACGRAAQGDLDEMKNRLDEVELLIAVAQIAANEVDPAIKDFIDLNGWLAAMSQIKNELLAWYQAGGTGGGGGGGGGGGEIDLSGTWAFEYQFTWTGNTGSWVDKKDCNVEFGDDGMVRGVCLIAPYTLNANVIDIFLDLGNGFTKSFNGVVSGDSMSGTWTETPNKDGVSNRIWSAAKTN